MRTVDVIIAMSHGVPDIEVYEETTDAFYRYYELAQRAGLPLNDISLYTAGSLVEDVEEGLRSTGKELIWEQQIQVR